jgi:hypothetical protein
MSDYNRIGIAAYLMDQVRRRPIGNSAFVWELAISLPIAPSIEESLRIAMQDWEGESVDLYATERHRDGTVTLSLIRGKPIAFPEMPEAMMAVFTDVHHRFHWRVTEASAGSAMSGPQATEEDAINAAKRGIERFGADGVRAAFRNCRDVLVTAFQRGACVPSAVGFVSPSEAATLQALGVQVETGDCMWQPHLTNSK